MEPARVPQHLELDDVVAWNLGALDLAWLVAGAVIGWWLYLQLPDPIVLRVAAAVVAIIIGIGLGVTRVGGLPLRGWVTAAVAFLFRGRLFIAGGRG